MKSWQTPDWTQGSYQLYRNLLGLYFITLLTSLLPWSLELFSREGLFPHADISPFWHIFPSLFFWLDSPEIAFGLQLLAIVAAIFFTIGKADRFSAFYLWFFLASAYTKNPLIANPSLPYLGWILLAHTLSPSHPLPRFLRKSLWWLLVAGCSLSGWYKLESPSWIDGTALQAILQSPLSRDNLFVQLLLKNAFLLQWMTWSSLALECLALPLSLIPFFQRWVWLSLTLWHLSILICIDFFPIALGMLLVHVLACDLDWIAKPSSKSSRPILLVDGDCAACSGFSQWVFQEDRQEIWSVGHLGGHTHSLLDPTKERGAIIVWDRELYRGWDAISYLLRSLGGWWYLPGKLMSFVPKAFSNPLYQLVTHFRHWIPKPKCVILPVTCKKRILN